METHKEFERINRIANGKIPVSEDSPVFTFFAERREICKKLHETMTEVDRKYLIEYFDKIEEAIKQYLWL